MPSLTNAMNTPLRNEGNTFPPLLVDTDVASFGEGSSPGGVSICFVLVSTMLFAVLRTKERTVRWKRVRHKMRA